MKNKEKILVPKTEMTNETPYNPAPWEAHGREIVSNATGYKVSIAHCTILRRERHNARLIAAAPELLEALEKVLVDYEDFIQSHILDKPENFDSVKQARAAISKATFNHVTI